MDNDAARWLMEFILRQPLDNRTLNALVRILPLSDDDISLKKGLLFKAIESEIVNGSVSEKLLGLLEQVEELDYRERKDVSPAMKAAYCAVAVHCTVKFLEHNEKGLYFDAVKRIWRSRVCQMDNWDDDVGLLSEELARWKDDIEAAVWDASVCKNVSMRSKEVDATEAVRVYLEEAKQKMGPSFLELVAETLSENTLREVLGMGKKDNNPKPSLMARNSTAQTYEWNDSIDSLPRGSQRVISLPNIENDAKPLRRKTKHWSNLEEDTLRTGVQKYGMGNWKLILTMYKDIFEGRTATNLKDKWRNLTR